MTTPANRFVVAPDPQGRSAVLLRGLTNVQSRERLHWSGAGFPMHHTDTLDCLTCVRGEIYLSRTPMRCSCSTRLKTLTRNEIERNTAMATHVNRFVVGPNAEGRSTVLQHGLTNVQSREGFYWRATLWATQETPVDNSIDGDRSQTEGLGASREPFPNGMICRALEIPPDNPDQDEHRRVLADLNQEVHQKHQPSQTDLARHPSMHHTDTLDCLTCVRGEIFLVTDTDEVLMQPGDTVIIRGTNHAWSNRSNAPCLLVGTMTDATPPNGG